MKVQVVESGPDGTQSVIWDTDEIRGLGVVKFEGHGDQDVDVDMADVANIFETEEHIGDETFAKLGTVGATDFSMSYCGLGDSQWAQVKLTEHDGKGGYDKEVYMYFE